MTHMILVRLAAALALAAAAPTMAAAATPQAIDAYFKRANPNCSANAQVLGSGTVTGAPVPLTLVNVAVEGCPGSENMATSDLFGVYEQSGRIMTVNAPGQVGIPQSATVTGGKVSVTYLQVGPRDPLCCPTVRKVVRLTFNGGRLVQDR